MVSIVILVKKILNVNMLLNHLILVRDLVQKYKYVEQINQSCKLKIYNIDNY